MYPTFFLVYLSYLYIIWVAINREVKIELLYLEELMEMGVDYCYLVLL